MTETSSPAPDWARDETTRSLLEIFDRADTHARVSRERHAEEVRRLRDEISRLHAEVLQLNSDLRQLGESMSRMQNTLSWRITKPIRTVRLTMDRLRRARRA